MKILVTGGTGFIGSYLVGALIKKGNKIKVIARDSQKAKSIKKIGAEVVFGELDDKNFLKKELAGIEVIYHLAAIPGQIWQVPWKEYQKINLDYTKNLLEASLENEIKRFIFCSSIQATKPLSFYGKSKLEGEKMVKKSGLEYVIIRPGIVYGPKDKKSIFRVCRLAKKGLCPLIGGGKARLPIVYIDDLIDLFLRCLAPGVKKKTFWGIGEEITFKEMMEIIKKELGKYCLGIYFPPKLAKVIAFPFEIFSLIVGTQPIISREQIDFFTLDWHIDISKEEKKFWQPKIKFNQGVKKTIRWYRKNSWL